MKTIISLGLLVAIFSACSSDHSKSADLKDSTNVLDSSKNSENSLESATAETETVGSHQYSLIIPGKSAGKVSIGQNAEEVYAAFGKADAGDAAMQKSVAIWYENHDPKSFATSIYTVRDTGDNPAALIKQVRVTSPEFKTGKGVGPTSTLADIQKKYSVVKLTDITEGGISLKIFDSLEGIAFEIDSNGICKAIIIHSGNESLKTTSLPLR